ncbi:MAG TPA: type II toxin-antitoxin system HicB family antitoxin [Caulobacteraceae bacterium]
MHTVIYPALAEADAAGGYRARFPDLPGCAAVGEDMGQLLVHAREAVGAHLKLLAERDEEWPKPSAIETIPDRSGALLMVDVQVEDSPVRVNLSIGEQLLKRIDAAAQARGMTRSGFVAAAARASLGEPGARPRAMPDLEAATRRMQDELSALGRKLTDSLGPDSAFSRHMAELDVKIYDSIQRTADNVSAAMDRRKRTAAGRPARPEA